jgi:hypothetical protein
LFDKFSKFDRHFGSLKNRYAACLVSYGTPKVIVLMASTASQLYTLLDQGEGLGATFGDACDKVPVLDQFSARSCAA